MAPQPLFTHSPESRTRNTAHGFSLIEVLMAVLILSLGLLGLGAIMPAVVKQQRVGADQTFGTLAARSVGALVKGNALLNTVNPTKASANTFLSNYNRWEGWARCLPSTGYTYGIPEDGSWMVMQVDAGANGAGTARTRVGPSAGTRGIHVIDPVDDAFINMQDRLVPSLTSVSSNAGVISEPQFVVDLAVRRMTPIITTGANNQLAGTSGLLLYERPGNFTVQIALISRRIDQRIRPGMDNNQPVSIMHSLTGIPGVTSPRLLAANKRWPISEDNLGNPLGGGETQGTGNPRYSLPYTVNVTYEPVTNDPDSYQRLVIDTVDPSALITGGTTRTADLAFQQISAPGQIIVDNLGTVYNVTGVDESSNTPRALRLSSPVNSAILGSTAGRNEPRRLHQVLVCPQPPASINIITVNP